MKTEKISSARELNPETQSQEPTTGTTPERSQQISNSVLSSTQPSLSPYTQDLLPKTPRTCRPPVSRRFAHICTSCSPPGHNVKALALTNNTSGLPPAAFVNFYLYDNHSKRCLPTSRNRDMLLKECQASFTQQSNSSILRGHNPCVYDDLYCDGRRNRCACKPGLHLFYESNMASFGCVKLGSKNSPDGKVHCRTGQMYSSLSNECHRIFDINELSTSYPAGVSPTQFSFVTIVLIWILLLILIVTAKLRKLRTNSDVYRNSPSIERRVRSGGGSSSIHQSQNASAWLHPFLAAVNGHQFAGHRANPNNRHRGLSLESSGNYNDTDFFISDGLRISDIRNDANFSGSQQSLNNPPPKFEEIYPNCNNGQQPRHQHRTGHRVELSIRPPSNEDLPTYDEAMKLQGPDEAEKR